MIDIEGRHRLDIDVVRGLEGTGGRFWNPEVLSEVSYSGYGPQRRFEARYGPWWGVFGNV